MDSSDKKVKKRKLQTINALEKQRKSRKRKLTPNTMRGGEVVGIVVGLQDHDGQEIHGNAVLHVARLKKSVEKLENF